MDRVTPWLTPARRDFWRTFIRMHYTLACKLERDLRSHSALSIADYPVLVALTDAPDGRQRLQSLAKELEQEQSRVSHHIARMAKRGLVTREPCAGDRRGVVIAITPAGREAIEAAGPRHVAAVRRLVIEPLTAEELRLLGRLSDRIIDRIGQDTP